VKLQSAFLLILVFKAVLLCFAEGSPTVPHLVPPKADTGFFGAFVLIKSMILVVTTLVIIFPNGPQ